MMAENKLKIDVSTASFSPCSDRFVKGGYRLPMEFEKQLEMLSRVEGLTGVALDYPTQFSDPHKLKQMLHNVGLALGMVEIDMFSNSKWKYGSLTSTNQKLRQEAINLVKQGIDAAIEAKAADVQLWLGQDGFDYPFQANYIYAWDSLVDAIKEIAEYKNEMKIAIEYKLKEPRNKIHISTVGRALLICQTVGLPHIGITLDVGHSLMAQENPAESAILASRYNRLFHLHLNDNYRDWDHDMIPGTINLWETIELFWWLKKINFDGWYGIDIYPCREDGYHALTRTIKHIYKFHELARKLEATDLINLQKENNLMRSIELLMAEIIK